jgi:hypothetical protein
LPPAYKRSPGTAAGPALPPSPTLEGLEAGADVMSNVDNVTATTTNTIVASANAAVSIGLWSNLASIASFLSPFALPSRRTMAPRSWKEIRQMAQ